MVLVPHCWAWWPINGSSQCMNGLRIQNYDSDYAYSYGCICLVYGLAVIYVYLCYCFVIIFVNLTNANTGLITPPTR